MRLTSPRSSDSLSSKFVRLMTNSPTRFTNSVKRSKSTRMVGLCGLETVRVGDSGRVGERDGESGREREISGGGGGWEGGGEARGVGEGEMSGMSIALPSSICWRAV